MNADIQQLITDGACLPCHGVPLTDIIKIGLMDRIATNCGTGGAPCVREDRSPGDYAAGLVAWYSPESIPAGLNDGDPITQWSDRSGNAYHLVQDGAFNVPTYRANAISQNNCYPGYGCAEFTATNTEYLINTGALGGLFSGDRTPFTLFVICRFKTQNVQRCVWIFSNTALGNPYHYWSEYTSARTVMGRRDNAGASVINTPFDSYGFSGFGLHHTVYGDGAPGDLSTWVNNSPSILTINFPGTCTFNRFVVGLQYYGVTKLNALDGYVMDIAIFNSALGIGAANSVAENYYNWKYGLW